MEPLYSEQLPAEEKVSAITSCPLYRGIRKNPRWPNTKGWGWLNRVIEEQKNFQNYTVHFSGFGTNYKLR